MSAPNGSYLYNVYYIYYILFETISNIICT